MSLVHLQDTARRHHGHVARSGRATHTVDHTRPARLEALRETHQAIPVAALACQISSIQPGECYFRQSLSVTGAVL